MFYFSSCEYMDVVSANTATICALAEFVIFLSFCWFCYFRLFVAFFSSFFLLYSFSVFMTWLICASLSKGSTLCKIYRRKYKTTLTTVKSIECKNKSRKEKNLNENKCWNKLREEYISKSRIEYHTIQMYWIRFNHKNSLSATLNQTINIFGYKAFAYKIFTNRSQQINII